MNKKYKIGAGCFAIVLLLGIITVLSIDAKNTVEYKVYRSYKWPRTQQAYDKEQETAIQINIKDSNGNPIITNEFQIEPISDEICEGFVKYFDNKVFEQGDKVYIKEICNELNNNEVLLNKFRDEFRRELNTKIKTSGDVDYDNYIVECSKKYYMFSHYDDDYLYLDVKVEKPNL